MTAQPIPSSPSSPSGAPSRTVSQTRPKAGLARFIVVLALILGAGMVGQLALATTLDGQAFIMNAKRHETQNLANQLSDLQTRLAHTSSVTSLAQRAARLGMKPDPHPAQLRLSDGKVLGKPKAVIGNEVAGDGYKTPEQFEAQRAAADWAAAPKPTPTPTPTADPEPATAEPATTKPATTKPATTKPATTKPADNT